MCFLDLGLQKFCHLQHSSFAEADLLSFVGFLPSNEAPSDAPEVVEMPLAHWDNHKGVFSSSV